MWCMGADSGGTARPLRHGEAWSEREFEHIVFDLADGLTIEHIGQRLQRTAGSVRGQLARLVPKDVVVKVRDREEWLRAQLAANPGYDWRAVLRSHADSDEHLIWMADEDRQLQAGWRAATRLPELAAQLRMSESAIVSRLVALGIAGNVADVVDRLGAASRGSVEARARLARGERAEAVYVLVVETAHRPLLSVHHSQASAEDQLRRTVEDPGQPEPRWWVLRRTLDGRDLGQHWTNTSGRVRMRLPGQRLDGESTTART